MKRKICALLMTAVLVMLTACGKSSVEDLSGDDGGAASTAAADETIQTTDVVRTPPQAPTDYVSDEELASATSFAGMDASRIAAVMKKAESGQDITVGVIGGSITQGTAASTAEKAYASIMAAWWRAAFPDINVTFINAGIGATDSYLGVHRVQQDLLDYNPDFVIVEFSVNDSASTFYKQSYDNLVRRILKSDSEPAVLLLYMTQEDGTSAVQVDGLVGFSYNLPQIGYGSVVLDKIAAGEFAWSDISPDNIHPNDKGHAICGELIWKYLNSIYADLDSYSEPAAFTASSLTREVYQTACILDSDDMQPELEGFAEGTADWSEFKGGWSTDNGGSITFTVTASRIGVLFYKNTSGQYGKAEVYVDGEHAMTLDGDFTGGWGNYGYAQSVYSDTESSEHRVQITVPEGEAFDVFGILISAD